MTVNWVRRWRPGLLVLLLVTVGGSAWIWAERAEAERHSGEKAATALPPASGVASAATQPVREAGSQVASTPLDLVAGAGSAPSSAPDAGAWVEICGFGRIKASELEKPADERQAPPAWALAADAAQTQRTAAARSQLAARLAAGSDAQRVASRLVMGDNDGAAVIAAQSQDAAAYRLGLAGCHYGESTEAPPSCRGLDVQGWIHRDPSDARPWMLKASQALQRRDVTATREALEEALRRPKLSSGEPLIAAAMKDAPLAVADRASLGMVSVDVMGRQASWGDWYAIGALGRYCSVEGLKEAQRLPLCQQLSRKWMDGADTLLEARVAQKVADRAGVPPDQQKYDAAKLTAAQDFFTEESGALLGFDCASLSRAGDFFVERAQRGELQIALDWLRRRSPGAAPAPSASAVVR